MADQNNTAVKNSNSGVAHHLVQWIKPRVRILAPLFTLIILAVFFGLVTNHFLTLRNLENIVEQASLLAILATGVTMVLLLGEIDLSFANTATLIGMVMALLADAEFAVMVDKEVGEDDQRQHYARADPQLADRVRPDQPMFFLHLVLLAAQRHELTGKRQHCTRKKEQKHGADRRGH